MKILGVDPGLRVTGYGLINTDGPRIRLLEAGTIEPKAKDLFQNRINKIYKNLDDLVMEYRPDVMVLEKIYTHYHHTTTASILGHVRGVICLLCAQRNLKLAEHSVKRIRKAVIGRGAASKLQTQAMVAHILKINKNQLTPDASDALALALGYAQIVGNKI